MTPEHLKHRTLDFNILGKSKTRMKTKISHRGGKPNCFILTQKKIQVSNKYKEKNRTG